MNSLNKQILTLAVYTAFLAIALERDTLYLPSILMASTAIINEVFGRLLDNRKLPVRNVTPIEKIEEEKIELIPRKNLPRKVFIEKENNDEFNDEFNEHKQILVKKALDNGYKMIKEKVIPEELKS